MSPNNKKKPLKRKRSKAEVSLPGKKHAKTESASEDEEESLARIFLLENEVLESKKNFNKITTLLNIARKTEDGEPSLVATVALGRVFLRLFSSGAFSRSSGQSEKEITVVMWLKERLGDYKRILLAALAAEDTASTALTLAMRLLKAEGQHMSSKEDYRFPRTFLKQIVGAIVQAGFVSIHQEFCVQFAGKYCDVRFYALRALKDILADHDGNAEVENLFESGFEILSSFEDVPNSAQDLNGFYLERPTKKGHEVVSVSQHRRQGQESWLALLGVVTSRDQRKRILKNIAVTIAPWFTKPELLADFLTDSYNSGGSVSVLSLEGVFYLIEHRNLDYPSFYLKLYSLLDSNILHSENLAHFFRLLDIFLASSHLPAVLVASFIKRLARLCLHAPPSAIVAVIPWIYNRFKKHPLCTFMIHREPRTNEEKALVASQGFGDPFIGDEPDPMETRAIDSCLWEVVQLQSHYYPNGATIAKIISEQFTKQSYNMEDFLDHSYGSLLVAEFAKKVKKPPVVEFMIPKRIFFPHDADSAAQDSLLMQLWDFT